LIGERGEECRRTFLDQHEDLGFDLLEVAFSVRIDPCSRRVEGRKRLPSHGIENGRRISGLVLLLRHSGMRIGDAVNFSPERLEGNRLFLCAQQKGMPANTILPEFVLSALEATPKVAENFFFRSGRGKLKSMVRS
jgi:hypothetical protein